MFWIYVENEGLNHVKNEPKIPHFSPHTTGLLRIFPIGIPPLGEKGLDLDV